MFNKKLKDEIKLLKKRLDGYDICLNGNVYPIEDIRRMIIRLSDFDIDKRLKVLECDHKKSVLRDNAAPFTKNVGIIFPEEVCSNCNKQLRTFTALEYQQEKLKRTKTRIKELKKANEKRED